MAIPGSMRLLAVAFATSSVCLSLVSASSSSSSSLSSSSLKRDSSEIESNTPIYASLNEPAPKRIRMKVSGTMNMITVSDMMEFESVFTSSDDTFTKMEYLSTFMKYPKTEGGANQLRPQDVSEEQRKAAQDLIAAIRIRDFEAMAKTEICKKIIKRDFKDFGALIVRHFLRASKEDFERLLAIFPLLQYNLDLRCLFASKFPKFEGTEYVQQLFKPFAGIEFDMQGIKAEHINDAFTLQMAIHKCDIWTLLLLAVDDATLALIINIVIPKLEVYLGNSEDNKSKFIDIVEAFPDFKRFPEVRNLFSKHYPNDYVTFDRLFGMN